MLMRVFGRRAVAVLAWRLCPFAALLVTAASSLAAQRVAGTLRDSATGEPLGGALVTLVDGKGAFLSHGISEPGGAFSVMRLNAAHTLRVLRIGYKPRDVVVASADTTLDVKMQPIAPLLPIVASKANRVCSAGPDNADAIALWEQVRSALQATVVSREVSPVTVHLHRFHRTIDALEHRVLDDSSEYEDLNVDKSFVAGRTAVAFAQQGYLYEALNGSRTYFAPDEEVLIDPTFAAQHCLQRVDGTESRTGLVGIAFAPITDAAHDTLVDIAGTLWLERERLALKELEFRYTNLEPDASTSGGVLTFTVMPNGVSMVSQWKITSSRVEVSGLVTASGYKLSIPRPRRVVARITGYDESGGEITDVDWRDTRRDVNALPMARGTVVDLQGRPVAGAFVWMRDTGDTTRTDANGFFALPRMKPGVAADSVMAREGLAQTISTRVALMGTGKTVSLEFHPHADVLASICPSKSYRAGTTVLRARVVDSRGRAAGNARIEVQFGAANDSTGSVQLPAARRGEADFNGVFTICGIQPNRALVLKAFKDDEGAGVIIDGWTDDIAAVTLPLTPLAKRPF